MSDKNKNSSDGKVIRRRGNFEKANKNSKKKQFYKKKTKHFSTNASNESLQKLADHFNNNRY